VIYTSDHGAFDRSVERKPLRGAKADLYEAGIRVPLILRWPGRFRAGAVVDLPIQNSDLVPTLVALAGVPPGPQPVDGLDLSDLLLRGARGLPARDLYWHFPHYHHLGLGPCGAIRSGTYKLIEWFEGSLGVNPERVPFELYDLALDPGEHRNLAEEQPERCAQLAERLRAWRRSVGAQEMTRNPDYDPTRGEEEPPPPNGDPGNPYGE
jgi:arylsulfatase A-like enzyme